MEYTDRYISPLGAILLAGDGAHLTGLWFEGQRHFAAALDPVHQARSLPVLDQTKAWLDLYFSGAVPPPAPPLRLKGTPFQREVFELLLAIPYGQTTSYGDIARRIAARRGLASMSAQAVGSAVGRNPVSLIVPCHRVVSSDGSLTGYAGGLERKQKLLALERGLS